MTEKIYSEEYSEYHSFAEGWYWHLNYDGKYLTVFEDENTGKADAEKVQKLKIQIEKNELC